MQMYNATLIHATTVTFGWDSVVMCSVKLELLNRNISLLFAYPLEKVEVQLFAS